MFGLGMPELIVILVIMLLLFGRRLPEVMRGMGKSVTEFKRGMNEVTEVADEVRKPVSSKPKKEQGDKLEAARDEPPAEEPSAAPKSIGPEEQGGEPKSEDEVRSEIGRSS